MADYRLYHAKPTTQAAIGGNPQPTGEWSVLVDTYADIGALDPYVVDEFVSGNHTEAEAKAKAASLQRRSYGERRQENADAAQD